MMDIRAEAAEAKKIRELYDAYELYKALRRIVDAWDANERDVAAYGSLLAAMDEARQVVELGAPVEDLGAP